MTVKDEAAGLIRAHLWRGAVPQSPDDRPWGMGRDLSIWQRLVDAGYDPAELNGAISVVRRLWHNEDALKMTVFYWKNAEGFNSTPFLTECIGLYHKTRQEIERPEKPQPTGLRRFSAYLEGGARGRFTDFTGE